MSEKENKSNILLTIIVIQLFIIIGLISYNTFWCINIYKKETTEIIADNKSSDKNNEWEYEDIRVLVIDDKRCNDCFTDDIVFQLSSLDFLSMDNIEIVDFSDEWIAEYLKDNEIKYLPAFIFNTNKVPDQELSQFLQPINSWEFSLNIWANFNPFQERSERWFPILEDWVLDEIKEISYIDWNKDAEITWIEYSDFGCTFCLKMHNEDKTPEKIKNIFWENLNIIFKHMPFRNTQVPPALECVWWLFGSEAYYSVLKEAFNNKITTSNELVDIAVEKWFDAESLNKCISEWTYNDIVNKHMELWQKIFNITWTPWNILINNITWEYVSLPWAYPASEFERVINSLMQ